MAMEYSPGNAIPYISRVDAGTVEAVRQRGRRRRLVGRSDPAVRGGLVRRGARRRTARRRERLYRIKDRAFEIVREARRDRPRDHRDRRAAGDGRLVRGGRADQPTAPRWSRRRRTPAIRTTRPTGRQHRAIGDDEVVLLDLWGKLPTPGAVFADITWVGFTGRRVPDRYAQSVHRGARRARRRGRAGADGGAERPRAARLRGGSRLPRRASSGPASAPSSSTAPATAWAPRSTATACTWTTTKPTTSGG